MAQDPSKCVRVAATISAFGAMMNEIRSWLDHRKIQPTGFKTNADGEESVVFDISFAEDDEAHLFERAFLPDRRLLSKASVE